MNDGLLIAMVSVVGSAVTVVANTALNMWGKWVDSNQKSNEHKFAVRSVYVTKRIEAGQAYISGNVTTLNSDYTNLSLLRHYCYTEEVAQDLQQAIFETKEIEMNRILKGDNYVSAFFDFSEFANRERILLTQFHKVLAEVQMLLKSIKNKQLPFDESAKQKINELIEMYAKKMELLRERNDFVRKELSKYDIL